jgi:tRNA pseudouridine55 synthase
MIAPRSGAIIIDKPEGLSSSDGVTRIKRALLGSGTAEKGFKIGHGGTLDPFATGVLVILFGEGTKLADCYLHSKKTYAGTLRLGIATDSGDLTGTPGEPVPVPSLDLPAWQRLADAFVEGPYLQVPPMHSAKKRDGVALYELARRGESVEREPLLKKIESFRLFKTASPLELDFETTCESGTYVRVLAEDLAKKAGTLAHLTRLRRIRSSDRTIEEARPLAETLATLSDGAGFDRLPNRVPLERLATHVPFLTIGAEEAFAIRQGLARVIEPLKLRADQAAVAGRFLILRQGAAPVALLERSGPGIPFRLQRVFAPEPVF